MADKTQLQLEREGLHSRMVSAFTRKDYAFESVLSADVSLEFAGSSPLAGTRLGHEEFFHHIERLGEVLRSAGKRILYLHRGDQMIAQHEVVVSAPGESVETTLSTTVTFESDGRAKVISVTSDHQDAFDRVLNSVLGDSPSPSS
jgi:ketosteroid isomerase-like protein